MTKHTIKEVIFSAVFGGIVALLMYTASQTVLYWPFLSVQNHIDDSQFYRRFKLGGADELADTSIVIVDIDSRTLIALGDIKKRYWPRKYMASVVENLSRDGARLIFLDILLQGQNRHNTILADSVRAAGNVIAGYYFSLDDESRNRRPTDTVFNEEYTMNRLTAPVNTKNSFIRAWRVVLPNRELVESVAALGYTNYVPDPDGILRHMPLYIRYGGTVSPSASLQMWLRLKGIHYSTVDITRRGVRFGETFIPTDRNCFMRINFPASEPVCPYYSFLDVLEGNYPSGTFRDKVVMIGSSSNQLGDLKEIPGYGSLPGVEIHAAVLSTLLKKGFLRVVPGNIVFAACLFAGIISGLLFAFAPPLRVGLPVMAVSFAGMYLTAVAAFLSGGYLLNITIPAFVIVMMYVVMTAHRFLEWYEGERLRKKALRKTDV